MGSLSRLIKEKGGQFEGVKTGQVRVQQIHYTKLKESQMNFYTRNEEEVEELADTMIIAGGILQPLIVRKTDLREYEILVQHCLLPPPCPDTNIRHCTRVSITICLRKRWDGLRWVRWLFQPPRKCPVLTVTTRERRSEKTG